MENNKKMISVNENPNTHHKEEGMRKKRRNTKYCRCKNPGFCESYGNGEVCIYCGKPFAGKKLPADYP
jgi:hypothetical protein